MKKKILVTGATGLAGAEVIRQAILDDGIESITALVRRSLTFSHPKLKTVLHQDFMDYSGVSGLFAEHHALVWCLGISQTQVNEKELGVITFDYTLAAAKAMLAVCWPVASRLLGFC